ncbi:MAG: hypothetical protein C0183_12975 [Roseiflexus castenholzii]|uniref:pPIWI_RE_Y domain-containing protein n=1 Tax=Roseiflexus castenholzii TaxID=120962 RepID=UPI000CB655FB|nr:MAG: hypothetical protein C0183_12975 [Roseiflexus castenholzii]
MDASHSEAARMLRPDEVTVHLIASGLIMLTQQTQDQPALTLPYPEPLQRGLNRLVLACLRRNRPPPRSVMDLLNWCREPLITWGLDLPDGSVADYERLLDDQIPTATCEAWARSGADIEANLSEETFMHEVITICIESDDPEAYTTFRRMLIERPALTALEFQQALGELDIDALQERLKEAYEPAPRSAAHNGQWATCAICGNLMLRRRRGELICEDEQCRAQGRRTPARLLPLRDGVVWLRRDLRRYIAMPGRAELQLAADLEKLGLQIALWPAFDRYDLRVTFPDKTVWAIDVKDWSNPFLLARSVNNKPFPNDPPWDRAFFVFPDARRAQRPDYVRAFCNALRVHSDRVEACFARDLLRRAKEQIERGSHA